MLESVPPISLIGDLLVGPAGKTRSSPFCGAAGDQLPALLQLASGYAAPVQVQVTPEAEKVPATRQSAKALASQRGSIWAAIFVESGVSLEFGFIELAGAETTFRGWETVSTWE